MILAERAARLAAEAEAAMANRRSGFSIWRSSA
jgi:hypothetical protein